VSIPKLGLIVSEIGSFHENL